MNDITEQEMTRYFSNNLRLLRNGRTPPISQQQLANQLHVDRRLAFTARSSCLSHLSLL